MWEAISGHIPYWRASVVLQSGMCRSTCRWSCCRAPDFHHSTLLISNAQSTSGRTANRHVLYDLLPPWSRGGTLNGIHGSLRFSWIPSFAAHPQQMQFDVDRTDAKRIEEVGGVHVLDIIKLSYHTSVCGTVLSADVEKAFCLIPVASYRDQQGVQPPQIRNLLLTPYSRSREGFLSF